MDDTASAGTSTAAAAASSEVLALTGALSFETIPTVRSRRPLWDLKHPQDPDWKYDE